MPCSSHLERGSDPVERSRAGWCALPNRFRLPEGLPPSFKGTAVKYSYHLEAHARFSTAAVVAQHQRQPSSSSVGSDTAQVSHNHTVVIRGDQPKLTILYNWQHSAYRFLQSPCCSG